MIRSVPKMERIFLSRERDRESLPSIQQQRLEPSKEKGNRLREKRLPPSFLSGWRKGMHTLTIDVSTILQYYRQARGQTGRLDVCVMTWMGEVSFRLLSAE